ncbi:hypothetical protein EYF80_034106 [Liparis tanakae]|uniref:Uncharacterized protein n=1 Tax=Liparis tanakae TaxID=230148 RepID=A0A4Z2GQU8_9TELE|nr:hypothetical protein EYF80_034106 [Liparis tanakae]
MSQVCAPVSSLPPGRGSRAPVGGGNRSVCILEAEQPAPRKLLHSRNKVQRQDGGTGARGPQSMGPPRPVGGAETTCLMRRVGDISVVPEGFTERTRAIEETAGGRQRRQREGTRVRGNALCMPAHKAGKQVSTRLRERVGAPPRLKIVPKECPVTEAFPLQHRHTDAITPPDADGGRHSCSPDANARTTGSGIPVYNVTLQNAKNVHRQHHNWR